MEHEFKGSTKRRLIAITLLAAQLVAACGGGGGGDPPAPAPIPVGTLSFVAGDLATTDFSKGIVDGPGPTARFNQIRAMVVAADGNLYAAEPFSIRRVAPDGTVTTIAGAKPTDTLLPGSLENVRALAVAGADAFYVSERRGLHRVTTGGTITTLAAFPESAAESEAIPADAIRTAQSLATDASGNLFLLDLRLGAAPGWRVRKREPDGRVIDVPGGFFPFVPTLDGPQPDRLAVDAVGNVYLSMVRLEQSSFCLNTCFIKVISAWVQKIAPDGSSKVLAGSMQKVGAMEGPGSQALFDHPSDIAVDGGGNVYVADLRNHAVRRISPQGQVTTVVGALPVAPDAPVPATALGPLPGRLRFPSVLAVAPDGGLFIAPGWPVGRPYLASTRNPGIAVVKAEGF